MTPLGENSCGGPHVPSLPAVRISELGLAGSRAGGFVELQGPPGTSLDGLSLVIFTSQEGAAHGSVPLGGNLSASGLLLLGGRNGETGLGGNLHSSSDGLLLLSFLPQPFCYVFFSVCSSTGALPSGEGGRAGCWDWGPWGMQGHWGWLSLHPPLLLSPTGPATALPWHICLSCFLLVVVLFVWFCLCVFCSP